MTGRSLTWTTYLFTSKLIYTKRSSYPGSKSFSFRNVLWVHSQMHCMNLLSGNSAAQIPWRECSDQTPISDSLGRLQNSCFSLQSILALWYPCLNRDPPTLYTKFLLISSCCTSSPSQLRFCYRGAGWPKAIDWRKIYSLSSGFSPEAESHLFGDFFLPSGSYCKLNSISHSSLYPFLQQGADIFLFHPSLISFGKGRHWVSSVTTSILTLSLFPSHKWKGKIHHLYPRILLVSLLMQAIWRISGHHSVPFFTTTSL